MKEKLVSQATRVVTKFGGAIRLSRLLTTLGVPITVSAVRKWTYSKAKGGTGGYIPSEHWDILLKAARLDGIVFSAMELDPRPQLEPENSDIRKWRDQASPIQKHGVKLPDDEINFGG